MGEADIGLSPDVVKPLGRCVDYPNAGQYQSCVAQAATRARSQGQLDNRERAGINRAAAVASCP